MNQNWIRWAVIVVGLITTGPLMATTAAHERAASSGTRQLQGVGPTLRVGAGCTYTTIQAAINAVPVLGEAVLRLRNQYFGENILIQNRSIELIGGHADCSTTASDGVSTLASESPDASTVRIIAGGAGVPPATHINVFMTNLDVQNGQSTNRGGGVGLTSSHSATVDLTLDNVWVLANDASDGGGMAFHSPLIDANAGQITLLNGSRLFNNHATSNFGFGGGLYCSGNFGVIMLGGDISGNTAGNSGTGSARGGGAYLERGCELTWFAQGSGSGSAELSSNSVYGKGGGLYVSNNSRASLIGAHFAFSPISTRPLRIRDNRSFQGDGGGIHATGVGAEVIVDRSWIHDNIGDWQGGALIATNGANIHVQRSSQTCHDNRNCSRIFGNRSGLGGGAAAFAVADDAIVRISRTRLYNNVSGTSSAPASLVAGPAGTIRLQDSLVHGPAGPVYTFYSNDGVVQIERSTIADTSPSTSVLFLQGENGQLLLFDSIVHETTGKPVATGGIGNPFVGADCVVWHDATLADLGDTARTVIANPNFADRANGNYYLAAGSAAINFCNLTPPAPGTDLEWRPRGISHSGQPNIYGPYDLGAFEFPDRIHADRFESP